MCGRFSQGEPTRHISDYFGAYPDDDLPDGLHNVPPTETIRVVIERDDARRLVAARWGFTPFWLEEPRSRTWINARAESAFDSPAFGPALRRRRCLIPADAFYEWDRTVTPRQPYAIGPSVPGEMLALAGIWSRSAVGAVTTAILTTRPNDLVAPIHNRMPVILAPDLHDDWLDPAAELDALAVMLAPAPEASLRIWPVSTAVNHVANDGPHLLDPVDAPRTLGLA